ncbi:MAG: hypothetical protein IT173_11120 [Acidobacteria bacterium]|nr:hypothetical protein [Acidobacteriota bacterium]
MRTIRNITAFIFAMLIFTAFLSAQTAESLSPGKPIAISLSPGDGRSFRLAMKAGDYAEVKLVSDEDQNASYAFLDEAGKVLSYGDTASTNSAVFIAPKGGDYFFIVKIDKSEDDKADARKITLEYSNKFALPKGSKQKVVSTINGFKVRIMFVPGEDPEYGDNVVLFEKGGALKGILRSDGNPGFTGFSFPDDPANAENAAQRKQGALIRGTADKTGDGIPDAMIDYYSGGAHCCFSTYFVNMGSTVDVVEVVNTDNATLAAIGRNPKGGLRFATNENAFAYWNISFAGSPMPDVILEFKNGELRPNFDLMKKPAPSMTKLRAMARAAARKISNNPYTEVGMDFEEAFWSEMLDLIYTGHEPLAWQYLDMVWPAKKPGKEKFKADFKEALAESYYGTRNINTSDSMRNSMRLFEKIYKSIKEQ